MIKFILALIIFFSTWQTAQAESIQSFDSLIKLNTNSNLQTAENITYDYGVFAKHGIIRYLPTAYHYAGQAYQLTYQDFQVPDRVFNATVVNDHLRLQIGSLDSLVTGVQIYNLNYQAAGAVQHLTDYDQLYLPLSGYGWQVGINNFTTRLELPRALKADQIQAQCFFGKANSTSTCDKLELLANDAGLINSLKVYQSQIPPGTGVSLSLQLPKDLLSPPSIFHRFRLLFASHPMTSSLSLFILLTLIIWISLRRRAGKSLISN